MKATAILPVKRFAAAKQRLGASIDATRRHQLLEAMLRDVLAAISRSRMVERILVVTGEPAAAEIAAELGAGAVPDPADAGHVQAALLGVDAASASGAGCVALLPGDCPLLEARELDRVLTGLPEPYVAIVPDRHGTGTNGLVLAPPNAIRPAFGEGSRERHVSAARAAGVPFSVEALDSLALDLDTPADVVAMTAALEGRRKRAPNTARALGI
ncbi:MAG TPA: 2-phospho-L-lactate guanylyltransferase [Solirubrobacterales bacterium]|nr:2-phospho-L-lactate guanylyltransferase [Solirubrobacterales bacterium]